MNSIFNLLTTILLLTISCISTVSAQSIVLRHRDGTASVIRMTDSLNLQTSAGGNMSAISGSDTLTYNNDDILSITFRHSKSDVNRDYQTNISDVVVIINTIAGNEEGNTAGGVTDVNGDGKTDISDVVAVINVIAGTDNTQLPAISDCEADYDSETGDAFYIFRNDGNFNAFLRADADSITFSKDKQLVHTPDSTYTIPLAAIDSVSFIIQKPVMHDGLFYLNSYHASHTTAIDSLTLCFDSDILADSLPNIGQVMINVTSTPPFDEGFVGKVVSVDRQDDAVRVECERAEIADVFKKLIVVGKVVSDDAEAPRRAVRRKDNSVPWVKMEESDIITDVELDDMSLSVLDGLLSLKSKSPKLTCSYYVYIDEMFYSIAADVYITHPDLTFGINFKGKKFYEYASDVSEFLTEQLMGPTGVKWEKPALQKFLSDGLPIPILRDGFFNLTLRIAPQIKISGDMEVDWLSKTSGRQHIGFTAKGFTATRLATMSDPIFSLIPYNPLGSITDWDYNYVQDPVKTQQLKLKVNGGIKFGLLLQLEANLLSEKCVHASLGVEAGAKADATLDVNLYESDYQSLNLYEAIKGSKLEVKDYVTLKGAIGASPFKFWELQGEVDLYEKVFAQYYLLPHFTEPSFPRYENGRWVNDTRSLEQIQPLCLYSNVSKNLIFNCDIGMCIEDENGKVVKEVKVAEPYLDETVWAYSHSPLKIDVSGLEPGKTYICYPEYCLTGSTFRKAYPYHQFTMPYPVSLSSTSLKLNPGESRVLRINGGWQQYQVVADNGNIDVSQYKHEVNDSTVTDLRIEAGTIGTTVVTVTDVRSKETVTLTVEVTGESLTQDAVRVSVPALDFGAVEPGEKKIMQFSVINERTTPVTFIIEDTRGEFEIAESGIDITLEPGETMTFNVVFSSSMSGREFSKEVTVSFGEVAEPQKISLTAKTGGTNSEQLRCTDDNHPHVIDMGAAGKWACCNVGATAPWETGGYFAWGETSDKTNYSLSTYEHCDGIPDTFHDLGSDIAGTEYDVALKTWGEGWAMPDVEQFQLLLDNCTSVWTNINGMNGRLFTAPNGATLFVPAAEFWWDSAGGGRNGGYYWSSVQDQDQAKNAFCFYLTEEGEWMSCDKMYPRYYGLTVRPVYRDAHPLKLSSASIDFGYVPVGASKTMTFTVTNSTEKDITFTMTKTGNQFTVYDSGDEITLAPGENRIVNVFFSSSESGQDYTGEIIIISKGDNDRQTIVLTATTIESDTQTYLTCPDSNHPHIIDMGVAGKWACCNVGASKPEDYGGYYAWGETEEKNYYDWNTYIHYDGDSCNCYNLGYDIAGTQYDVAHVKWGGSWRMPSHDQQGLLFDNCSSEWTVVNDINGLKFTAPNGGTIFLPAAGRRWYGNLGDVGKYGDYWSSTQYPDDSGRAYYLGFGRGYANWGYDGGRSGGFSVRPVSE